MRRLIRPLLLLGVAAAVHLGRAQTPPAVAASDPTFRSATRLVQIDVIARAKGNPATGLAKENFTLLDNGKPQEIAFFSVRSRASKLSSEPASAPLPPGAVTNRLERDGESLANATVLFIDQKNTPQVAQAFAIQRIVKFVKNRREGDRIGIYTFLRDGSVHIVQELTADAAMLNRAADSLKATDPSFRTSDTTGMSQRAAEGYTAMQLMERGMDSKHALQTIARHLANAPGRKSLVWITTAFPLFVLELAIDFRPDLEEVARQLNDANIALYAVDARGLQGALSGLTAIPNAESSGAARSPLQLATQMRRGGEGNPMDLATMNMLAGLTGGLVFYNKSNSIEESIRTAADDGELTYTLGFYPSQMQDGTWHKLKVEVGKKGVSVRYRENYFASREGGPTERPTLEQVLRAGLNATQLALLAEAAPDPERPGFLRVKVNVDLHDLQLEHENARRSGVLAVSFYVEGTSKVLTKTLKIDIPDDQFAAYLEKGIDTAESIDAAGGAEAFRIVAQDQTTGAAGSVTVPLPKNRDRGKPRGFAPPTPPDMRVRIRRFGGLSHWRMVNLGIPSEAK